MPISEVCTTSVWGQPSPHCQLVRRDDGVAGARLRSKQVPVGQKVRYIGKRIGNGRQGETASCRIREERVTLSYIVHWRSYWLIEAPVIPMGVRLIPEFVPVEMAQSGRNLRMVNLAQAA